MNDIPQRISLIAQTEKVIAEGIARSRWKIRLPAERELGAELQVSRGTLRAALKTLAARKLIRIEPGRTARIAAQRQGRPARGQPWHVGFLAPAALSRLDPFVVLWVDELRERLHRLGGRLDFYANPRCYVANCAGRLEELTRQNPHPCWILLLSTDAIQQWFQRRGVPAIVAGSLGPGVNLPSIDIDFRAVGRHAGGMMFARGHRRVALLASSRGRTGVAPGILEIERGLREAFAASRRPESDLSVVYHDTKPGSVCGALDRMLAPPRAPTALLIGQATTLLTTLTHLAQRRVVIPGALSVIITHDESFLRHIVPELTHYEWNPDGMARRYQQLVQFAIEGRAGPSARIRLMPRFIEGRTLAVPRGLSDPAT